MAKKHRNFSFPDAPSMAEDPAPIPPLDSTAAGVTPGSSAHPLVSEATELVAAHLDAGETVNAVIPDDYYGTVRSVRLGTSAGRVFTWNGKTLSRRGGAGRDTQEVIL